MTINRNDPRWTAYVLNEMEAAERARFELEIQSDPDAEDILEEIGETAALLGSALEAAPITITAQQRRAIEDAAVARHSPVNTGRWTLASVGGIAALVLVGLVTILPTDRMQQTGIPDPGVIATSDLDTDRIDGVPLNRAAGPAASQADPDTPAGAGVATDTATTDPMAAQTSPAPSPDSSASPDGRATLGRATLGRATLGRATLVGRVTDSAGAVIPGAEVTLTPESGQQRLALTNSNGDYRFEEVNEGRVDLRAVMAGFSDSTERFDVADDASRDLTLEVATMAATVEETTTGAMNAPGGASVRRPVATITGAAAGRGASDRIEVYTNSLVAQAAASPPPTPPAAPRQGVVGGVISEIAGRIAGEAAAAVRDTINPRRELNTEEYARINDNPFFPVSLNPLATFSADVDTASYANVRRFLSDRMLPPRDAVRIEEMVNYFTYDYAPPVDGRPVRIHAEVAAAPWQPNHRLVRIGIQGQPIERDEERSSNLVFLIDVSGSMNSPDKLGLLKDGLGLLVEQLGANDRVAIVVYAGASGRVLDSTPGNQKQRIFRAIERLSAGGSTNGAAGIELAYDTAIDNFIDGGVNRVILATDGDFNVGISNTGELTRLIEEKAESGVFLSVLGFGSGNLNDAGMEALADNGNGNYAYIDSIREARKVLVDQVGGTLVTIAKDVKFQVEFNPLEVSAYRLIGYENRVLEDQDFNDDTADAGEIGAGHTVTALFEIVPIGVQIDIPGVDPLRYQAPLAPTETAGNGELLTVKVRYKEPESDSSLLIDQPLRDSGNGFADATPDYRFATAVAEFGMILRGSGYPASATLDQVLEIAGDSLGADPEGYRNEFVDLVRRARALRDLEALDDTDQ